MWVYPVTFPIPTTCRHFMFFFSLVKASQTLGTLLFPIRVFAASFGFEICRVSMLRVSNAFASLPHHALQLRVSLRRMANPNWSNSTEPSEPQPLVKNARETSGDGRHNREESNVRGGRPLNGQRNDIQPCHSENQSALSKTHFAC